MTVGTTFCYFVLSQAWLFRFRLDWQDRVVDVAQIFTFCQQNHSGMTEPYSKVANGEQKSKFLWCNFWKRALEKFSRVIFDLYMQNRRVPWVSQDRLVAFKGEMLPVSGLSFGGISLEGKVLDHKDKLNIRWRWDTGAQVFLLNENVLFEAGEIVQRLKVQAAPAFPAPTSGGSQSPLTLSLKWPGLGICTHMLPLTHIHVIKNKS